jgi:hypothetical protein
VTPNEILVLDANCFKFLEDNDVRCRVRRSLRAVGLTLWPTALNILELAKNRNLDTRKRVLDVAAECLDGRYLLPLPDQILVRMGKAVARGDTSFNFNASGFEWMLADPDEITPEHVATIEAALKPADDSLAQAFENARPGIQRSLKDHDLHEEWASAADFLDRYWSLPEQRDSLVLREWERLGLPGIAPVEILKENEVWRLHFEGFGAAMFGRVIAREQIPMVQAHDISQLTYLATWHQRVFVSNDNACLDVARNVVHGRYANARVLSWIEFLDLC